jgi:hypothetical protein
MSDEVVLKVSDLLKIGDPYKGVDLFGRGSEKINFQF